MPENDTKSARVRDLETLEPVIGYPGDPNGVLAAGEGTLCWDYVGKCLYINMDSLTTWLQCCCQPMFALRTASLEARVTELERRLEAL